MTRMHPAALATPMALALGILVHLLFGPGATPLRAAPAPPEPEAILLWPQGAPGSEHRAGTPEVVDRGPTGTGERRITQVHAPSIIPYLPRPENRTGAAVLIAPGGGHRVLAIDHEGYNLGPWLAERGIAAFVLKYRLARETNSTYTIEGHALADTQRALRLVRSRARDWGIDPARLGVMGFSAGGELAAMAAQRPAAGIPDARDPVEREEARAAFQALIYPGQSRNIVPGTNSPPVFLACAFDDRPDISEGLASVYLAFKKAGVPAELHVYSTGGHGFGYRTGSKKSAGSWVFRFEDWLRDRGFVGTEPAAGRN